MSEYAPSRQQKDLADIVEMLLDKGVVINADIAVSIGDTQLLGIQVRAAIASFDTAARYGLEFPEGTDMRRMAEAVGDPAIAEMDRPRPPIDPTRGVSVSAGDRVADDEGEGEPIGVEEAGTGREEDVDAAEEHDDATEEDVDATAEGDDERDATGVDDAADPADGDDTHDDTGGVS